MQHNRARNSPTKGPLPAKQESAALSLAAGMTQETAAEESGAGVRTIKTWLATRPVFRSRIRFLRAEMTNRALGRLTDQMVSAATTLGYLSVHATSESTRLSAARAVIELGTRLRETVELEERIAALESHQSPCDFEIEP